MNKSEEKSTGKVTKIEDRLSGARVLVTGATGFTGSYLVRKLVETGAKVTAIARLSSDIQALQDLDIEWVRGDVFDEETVTKAVDHVSYIFHVAAAYREAKISDETYYKVHVKATQLLAKAALKQSHFERFVHTSTVGVHGHIEHPPADENYSFHPGDIYQKTKAEAELWIRNFADKEQLPLVVVRPAAIYGPRDARLLKVFKMASKKYFPLLGNGHNLYHLIYVEDLVRFFIHAATHPQACGEVFICGNTEPISLQEMARIIANVYKVKNRFIRLPAAPFFLAGYVCEILCRPLRIEPPIYRRRVAFFTKDRAFDTQKMQTVLGFSPKFNNKEGLEKTARWYLEHGWVRMNS
jgi:dihydroflavonol-4-reductase